MNSLENAICKATKQAFNHYCYMTGCRLLHAPEHFLQTVIAMELGNTWLVHPEGTRHKIVFETGRALPGRRPKSKIRHDLVIWKKSNKNLRAIVELKRVNHSWYLKSDARRIKKISRPGLAGYLLVYSEVRYQRGTKALIDRFKLWENRLNLKIVGPCGNQQILGKEGEWIAGFCLMRTRRKTVGPDGSRTSKPR